MADIVPGCNCDHCCDGPAYRPTVPPDAPTPPDVEAALKLVREAAQLSGDEAWKQQHTRHPEQGPIAENSVAWSAERETWSTALRAALVDTEAALRREAALKAALQRYGAHTPDCDILCLLTSNPPLRKPCSCGLATALTGGPRTEAE